MGFASAQPILQALVPKVGFALKDVDFLLA